MISDNLFLSLESSLFYFRFGFFVLSIWYIANNNVNFLKNIYYIFLIVILFVLIDGFIQFFTGFNFLGYAYEGGRLSGIFGEEKILGSFLSRILPIFFGLTIYLFSKNKIRILIPLLIIVLIDILVFVTGERTAFFNLILFSLIVIFFTYEWKLIRLLMISISIILIAIVSTINSQAYDRMVVKTLEQTNILEGKPNIFSIQHQTIYKSAYKIFLDNPIIGIGPKMFREVCKDNKYQIYVEEDRSINGCQTHPHNFMLQLFTETGIIGAIPVISLFLFCIFLLFKNIYFIVIKKSLFLTDAHIILLSPIIINLWPLVPSGNFFNNYMSILIYFPLGFLIYLVYSNKNYFNKSK